MVVPPSYEGREVLQPSVLTIPGHSVRGVPTPRYHHCASDGVSYGTAVSVIYNVTNLIITLNTYKVLYLSGKPISWVPLGLIRVVELMVPKVGPPPMR